jgi:anti-sigma regulatory factor (Ser/Thr protein kinase)
VADAGTVASGELTSWDGASAESLAQALAAPTVDCVEHGVTGPQPHPARPRRGGGRLGLRVTAQAVYRHPIAKVFAAGLRSRLDLSAALHERLHTALQEAMMNAMLHGNLGLESGLRDNLQALAVAQASIEARLAIGQIAHSMIEVEAHWSETLLRVTVRDSGGGFQRNALPSLEERLAAGKVGSGRGLMLLEMLCDRVALRRGGTSISLVFRLKKSGGRFGLHNQAGTD